MKSVPNFSTTNSFAQDANRVRFSRTGRPIFAHLPTRIRRNEISSRHTLKVCKQNSRANKLKLLRIVRIINFALHIDFNIALYEFEINDEFSLRVIKLIKIQNIQKYIKYIYKFVKDKSGGKNENYFDRKYLLNIIIIL